MEVGLVLHSAEHSLPEDVVYSCLVAFVHVFQSGEHIVAVNMHLIDTCLQGCGEWAGGVVEASVFEMLTEDWRWIFYFWK